jgi:N-acetylmuramoyl-L-alanine amidase
MNITVILDAGHGGIIDGVYQTHGKRSPIWEDGSQYFEGVGNRQIDRKSVV